jgi:WD40 repeat protein
MSRLLHAATILRVSRTRFARLALTAAAIATPVRADFLGVTWEGNLVRVDASTGAALTIGHSGAIELNSSAVAPDGTLIAASKSGSVSARLWTIDRVLGTATFLHWPFLNDIRALAFSPEGTLYAADSGPGGTESRLYTLDLTVPVGDSGIKTLVGQVSVPGIIGMTFSPNGTLFGWSLTHGLVVIDRATGQATDVNGTIDGSSIVQSLAFDASGVIYGVYENLYRIDPVTGGTTLLGVTNASIRGFEAFDFMSVYSYCQSKTNSLGCPPSIEFSGSPTQGGPDDFNVSATRVVSGKTGFLIWSASPASTPLYGGTLCLASPIVRTPPQNSGGTSPPDDCSGSFSYTFAHAYAALHGVSVGSTLHAQYYYRDPAHPDGTGVGLSDALRFTWLP